MKSKVKSAGFYKSDYDGNISLLEIVLEGELEDIIDEFDYLKLMQYDIKRDNQFSKIIKLLKDSCYYTEEEIDDIIYLLAKEAE